jgi:putative transposase
MNFTAAFDAVLADAGIRTVLCNIQTPRMNAITERWIGAAAASSWTAPSSGTRPIFGRSCASTRPTTIRTGRTAHCTAPLKPLPEPVNLDHYRVRKHAHVGGMINEYRLVA